MESSKGMYVIKPTKTYTLARDAIRDFVAITYQASFVGLDKNLSDLERSLKFLEATPGFGPGVEVLQTFALPLGYVAVFVLP